MWLVVLIWCSDVLNSPILSFFLLPVMHSWDPASSQSSSTRSSTPLRIPHLVLQGSLTQRWTTCVDFLLNSVSSIASVPLYYSPQSLMDSLVLSSVPIGLCWNFYFISLPKGNLEIVRPFFNVSYVCSHTCVLFSSFLISLIIPYLLCILLFLCLPTDELIEARNEFHIHSYIHCLEHQILHTQKILN